MAIKDIALDMAFNTMSGTWASQVTKTLLRAAFLKTSTSDWELVTIYGTTPLDLYSARKSKIHKLIQYGKCIQNGVSTPYSPIDILCNNGVLKFSKNLFSKNVVLGGTITNSGASGTTNPARARLEYQLFNPGTYTVSTNGICNNIIIWGYSNNSGANPERVSEGTSFVSLPYTFTLTSSKYIRCMCRHSSNYNLTEDNIGNFQIEYGITPTQYHPPGIYTYGVPEDLTIGDQTASVETLLGVDAYTDNEDIISGEITKNIGVYVITGLEPLTLSRSGRVYFTNTGTVPNLSGLLSTNFDAICTHFSYVKGNTMDSLEDLEFIANGSNRPYRKNGRLGFQYDDVFTSVDAAQEWFYNNYINGTPVIVIYKVFEAVKENVPPQELKTTDGYNSIDINANVDNIYLEVTYEKRK